MIQRLTLSVGIWLAAAATAGAQHAGHERAAQPTSPADPQLVAACVQSHRQAGTITARVSRRIEAARQTNNPGDMRAAMDDLQAALTELRGVLQSCDPLQGSAAQSDSHAGHARPNVTEAPAGPAEAVDPVCGMKVDPKTAPRAEHQGKTYYFCAESDRQLFLKEPAKYLK